MKYAVYAEWNGTTAWWGAYEDLETAKQIAEKKNGKVYIWGGHIIEAEHDGAGTDNQTVEHPDPERTQGKQ